MKTSALANSRLVLGALGGLVLLLYVPVLGQLASVWWNDPDYSHGLWIPLIFGYLVWMKKDQLSQIVAAPNPWGAALFAAAIVLLFAGQAVYITGWGTGGLFVKGVSFIIACSGLVLLVLGWGFLKALILPLIYLFLMLPLPGVLYDAITQPLQTYASKTATVVLYLLKIPVLREGNILIFPGMRLGVEEACSGIRSLFSLLTVGGAFVLLFMVQRQGWQRLLFFLSAVPIAVVTNALRVTVTGVMAYHIGLAAAEGFFHEFSGGAIFIFASILLGIEFYLVNKVPVAWPREDK